MHQSSCDGLFTPWQGVLPPRLLCVETEAEDSLDAEEVASPLIQAPGAVAWQNPVSLSRKGLLEELGARNLQSRYQVHNRSS